MNKTSILIVAALVSLPLASMQAQGVKGFLNKAKQKVEKVKSTVDNLSGKQHEQTVSHSAVTVDSEPADYESAPQATTARQDPSGPRINISDMPADQIKMRFGTFKTTATTKTIQVDNFNEMCMGYFFGGRALVKVTHDGIFCIDEKGNKLKTWDENHDFIWNSSFTAHNTPKFSSGRLLVCEQQKGSHRDAVIYDANMREVKRISNVHAASHYEDGVAIVQKKGEVKGGWQSTYGIYVDTNGNEILQNLSAPFKQASSALEPQYIRPLCEGLAAFPQPRKDGDFGVEWGFRDKSGRIVIPAKYSYVHNFSNGLAAVATGYGSDARWGYIDTKGNTVIEHKFAHEPSDFDVCGMALVQDREGRYTPLGRDGDTGKARLAHATPFVGGRALIVSGDGAVCFISSDGQLLGTYEQLSSHITEARAGQRSYTDEDRYAKPYPWSLPYSMLHDGKYYLRMEGYDSRDRSVQLGLGLLADNGDLVICGLYGPFESGLAPVCNVDESEVGYVNTKGEWVVKFEKSEF